jgi:hypothetical protein
MRGDKMKKKSLVGWTLKKPILLGGKHWSYIDDGKDLITICTRPDFDKSLPVWHAKERAKLNMFKKVRITIEELK